MYVEFWHISSIEERQIGKEVLLWSQKAKMFL